MTTPEHPPRRLAPIPSDLLDLLTEKIEELEDRLVLSERFPMRAEISIGDGWYFAWAKHGKDGGRWGFWLEQRPNTSPVRLVNTSISRRLDVINQHLANLLTAAELASDELVARLHLSLRNVQTILDTLPKDEQKDR